MLCERCHTREAVIHLTQVFEGRGVTRHFCPDCAQAHGAATFAAPAEPPRRPRDANGPRHSEE